jgi:hypothetical protein
MREVSRHLFIPRRPLIASMLASDPDSSCFWIANASPIMAARPALTSASAPFSMTRRFPLPARRSFASIDKTTGSRSGRWRRPPASSAAATFARLRRIQVPQPGSRVGTRRHPASFAPESNNATRGFVAAGKTPALVRRCARSRRLRPPDGGRICVARAADDPVEIPLLLIYNQLIQQHTNICRISLPSSYPRSKKCRQPPSRWRPPMCSLYPFIALLSNGGICDRAEPHSALDAASPAQLKTDSCHPQLADLLPLAHW